MGRKYNSILDTVGNTPVVKINNIGPRHVNIYAKIEAFNPLGSVKDRLALNIIEVAEKSGALKPGQTVVEATSGNTGIGLAMVCAQKGYPLVIVMAESFSVERRRMMRFLGAKVVLTPASEKGSGMVLKAEELAETHGWFLTRQFENEANPDMHSRTTAQEILRDFEGEALDYWVTGYGTGGTLKGVGRVLRVERPETKIIVCEPDNSQLLASGKPQARDEKGDHSESHPNFRPHLMQGWVPDFIPKITESYVETGGIDQYVPINGEDALQCARDLASKEGIFVGISAGATLAGALKIAETAPEGSNILCMLPDTGERYLSTPLFEGVPEDMTDEEIDISMSSPTARFDGSGTSSQPQQAEEKIAVTAEGLKFFKDAINDKNQPVVMFAHEWCEFCWSARKLFAALNIPYRSIDLDSVAYQDDEMGLKIRAALTDHTDIKTIPQIFIGGEIIGGSTDFFDAYKDGSLLPILRGNGVEFDETVELDPYELLPKWLHPRAA